MTHQPVKHFEPLRHDASQEHLQRVSQWKSKLGSENFHTQIEGRMGLANDESVQAFDALVETLSHAQPESRQSALNALTQYPHAQTFRPLVRAFLQGKLDTRIGVLSALLSNRHELALPFVEKHLPTLGVLDQARVLAHVNWLEPSQRARLVPFLVRVRQAEKTAFSNADRALLQVDHPDAYLALSRNPSKPSTAAVLKGRLDEKQNWRYARHVLTLVANHPEPNEAKALLDTRLNALCHPFPDKEWRTHPDGEKIKPWARHALDAHGHLRFDAKATALNLLRVLDNPSRRPPFKNPQAFTLSIKQTTQTINHK